MKLPKPKGKLPKKDNNNKTRRHQREQNPDVINEMLKLCLQKICQLQAELETEADEQDAEAAGYTACAMETLRFLSEHGLAPDHPMVKAITEKLLRDRD